jgi:hypothetical protein
MPDKRADWGALGTHMPNGTRIIEKRHCACWGSVPVTGTMVM